MKSTIFFILFLLISYATEGQSIVADGSVSAKGFHVTGSGLTQNQISLIGTGFPRSASIHWSFQGFAGLSSIVAFETDATQNAQKSNLLFKTSHGNMRLTSTGDLGIGTSTPMDKLQVGEMGDGTKARANSWELFSDYRWKKRIIIIDDPIEKLKAIGGYYYYWKEGKDQSRQMGVIAQEVEKVLPEAVSTDKAGYKSVAYGKLSALLIEVVKKQQSDIDVLTKEVAQIKHQMNLLSQESNAHKKIHFD